LNDVPSLARRLLNMAALREHGVDRAALIKHYLYCMEFLWRRVAPRESDKLTIVLDCEARNAAACAPL
jgi:hypothetical protein